jgi:hypothetical protein
MKKLVLAMLVCLVVLLAGGTVANARTPSLKKLAKTVAALQKKVKTQAVTIASQGRTIGAQGQTITAQSQAIASQSSTITTVQGQLVSAQNVLQLAPYVSVNTSAMNGVAGPNIVFKGVNVHVMSSTAQEDTSGLGNLIVGWDTPLVGQPASYRAGSNNLVCGDLNGFTTYGGFVAGWDNYVSASYATVSGGYRNVATGTAASVSGGQINQASGPAASVTGGTNNTASVLNSSVSGGSAGTEAWINGWRGGTFESH